MIAPPLTDKPVTEPPSVRSGARRASSWAGCAGWSLVGYSMPDADGLVRSLFATDLSPNLEDVVIVDPSQAVRSKHITFSAALLQTRESSRCGRSSNWAICSATSRADTRRPVCASLVRTKRAPATPEGPPTAGLSRCPCRPSPSARDTAGYQRSLSPVTSDDALVAAAQSAPAGQSYAPVWVDMSHGDSD